MTYKLLSIIALIGLLTISISIKGQEPKATEDSMKATKTITPTILAPIIIPSDMKEAIAQVNQSLELARLKKENVILQLRLLLKVPNEFIYNEATLTFDPPKEDKVNKKTSSNDGAHHLQGQPPKEK